MSSIPCCNTCKRWDIENLAGSAEIIPAESGMPFAKEKSAHPELVRLGSTARRNCCALFEFKILSIRVNLTDTICFRHTEGAQRKSRSGSHKITSLLSRAYSGAMLHFLETATYPQCAKCQLNGQGRKNCDIIRSGPLLIQWSKGKEPIILDREPPLNLDVRPPLFCVEDSKGLRCNCIRSSRGTHLLSQGSA